MQKFSGGLSNFLEMLGLATAKSVTEDWEREQKGGKCHCRPSKYKVIEMYMCWF